MDAKKLIDAIGDAGYEARSYSGRGMYGKHCVGVEISSDDSAFKLAAMLAYEMRDDDDFLEELMCLDVAQDSLGYDTILYFPRVAWPDNVNESSEGEENYKDD